MYISAMPSRNYKSSRKGEEENIGKRLTKINNKRKQPNASNLKNISVSAISGKLRSVNKSRFQQTNRIKAVKRSKGVCVKYSLCKKEKVSTSQKHKHALNNKVPARKCPICQGIFLNKLWCKKHINRIHGKLAKGSHPERVNQSKIDLVNSCQRCGRWFQGHDAVGDLKKHMYLSHSRVKAHHCTECNKGFSFNYQCIRHVVECKQKKKELRLDTTVKRRDDEQSVHKPHLWPVLAQEIHAKRKSVGRENVYTKQQTKQSDVGLNMPDAMGSAKDFSQSSTRTILSKVKKVSLKVDNEIPEDLRDQTESINIKVSSASEVAKSSNSCIDCGRSFAFKCRLASHRRKLHGDRSTVPQSTCSKGIRPEGFYKKNKRMPVSKIVDQSRCALSRRSDDKVKTSTTIFNETNENKKSIPGVSHDKDINKNANKSKMNNILTINTTQEYSDSKLRTGVLRRGSCPKCDKVYTGHMATANLRNHYFYHISQKPYSCPVCSQKFIVLSNVRKHVRAVHPKDTALAVSLTPMVTFCTKCFKVFTGADAKALLTAHAMTHGTDNLSLKVSVTDNSKTYECTVCGRQFWNGTLLKKHQRTYHSVIKNKPNAKEKTCEKCPKVFKGKNAGLLLHSHSSSHSCPLSLFCPYCNREYRTKASLCTHVSRNHKKKIPSLKKDVSNVVVADAVQDIYVVRGEVPCINQQGCVIDNSVVQTEINSDTEMVEDENHDASNGETFKTPSKPIWRPYKVDSAPRRLCENTQSVNPSSLSLNDGSDDENTGIEESVEPRFTSVTAMSHSCPYGRKGFRNKILPVRHTLLVHGKTSVESPEEDVNRKKSREKCGKVFKGPKASVMLSKHILTHLTVKLGLFHKKMRKAKEIPVSSIVHSQDVLNETKTLEMTPHDKINASQIDKSVVCSDCGIRYRNRSLLLYHKKNVHPNNEKVKKVSNVSSCMKCDKVFTGPYRHVALYRHKLTHLSQAPFACADCDHRFLFAYQLRLHSVKRHGKVVDCHSLLRTNSCKQCSAIYATGFQGSSNLKRHMLIHASKGRVYTCSHCGWVFGSYGSVYQHTYRVHATNNGSRASRKFSMQSSDSVGQVGDATTHCITKSNEDQQPLPETNVMVKSEIDFNNENEEYGSNSDAIVIGKTKKKLDLPAFKNRSRFNKKHSTIHLSKSYEYHQMTGTSLRRVSLEALNEYSRAFSGENDSLTMLESNTSPPTLGEVGHDGQNICPDCGQRFTARSSLNRHLRLVHKRKYVVPSKAAQFGQGLKQKYLLKNCKKNVQVNKNASNTRHCVKCNKVFVGRYAYQNMYVHMHSHMLVKPYTCTDCGKGFGFPFSLKSHMKTTHGKVIECDSVRVNSCIHCPAVFMGLEGRSLLRNHIKTHEKACFKDRIDSSERKAFECQFCGCAFVSNCSLRNHVKRIHISNQAESPANKEFIKKLANVIIPRGRQQNDKSSHTVMTEKTIRQLPYVTIKSEPEDLNFIDLTSDNENDNSGNTFSLTSARAPIINESGPYKSSPKCVNTKRKSSSSHLSASYVYEHHPVNTSRRMKVESLDEFSVEKFCQKESSHTCFECGVSFKHENVLNTHMSLFHRKVFSAASRMTKQVSSCDKCNTVFMGQNAATMLTKHYDKHRPITDIVATAKTLNRFNCSECAFKCSLNIRLNIHLKNVHSGKYSTASEGEIVAYQCDECHMVFKGPNASSMLAKHKLIHVVVNSNHTKNVHAKEKVKSHQINVEYSDLQDMEQLKQSKCTVKSRGRPGIPRTNLLQKAVSFSAMNEVTYNQDYSNTNIENTHKITDASNSDEVGAKHAATAGGMCLRENVPKWIFNHYSCEICRVRFVSKFRLNKHLKLHPEYRDQKKESSTVRAGRPTVKASMTSTGTHVDEQCDERERTRNSERSTNSNDNRSKLHVKKAEICREQYSSTSIPYRSVRTQDVYKCKTCNMKFAIREDLKTHVLTHQNTRYKCTSCVEQFQTLAALQAHTRLHNSRPLRVCNSNLYIRKKAYVNERLNTMRHSCIICKHQFFEKGTLRRHLRLQAGRPHSYGVLGGATQGVQECEACKRSFPDKHLLDAHLRIYSGKIFHK